MAWWETLTSCLREVGLKQCRYDPGLWYLKEEGEELRGLIHIHVDDGMHAGDSRFEELMQRLARLLNFSEAEQGSFLHLGIKIDQNRGSGEIPMTVKERLDRMEELTFALKRAREETEVLRGEEEELYWKNSLLH